MEIITTITAICGLILSLVAVALSTVLSKSSMKIASEALETSRQANNIALGLIREPAIIEFESSQKNKNEFDFVEPDKLKSELDTIIQLENSGNQSIDAISIEIIGLSGFFSAPNDLRIMPSTKEYLSLSSVLQPRGAIQIDMRRYILRFVSKLSQSLNGNDSTYTVAVNIVLYPKSVKEQVPTGILGNHNFRDRSIFSIRFSPSILKSPEAKRLLETDEVIHRIFDY